MCEEGGSGGEGVRGREPIPKRLTVSSAKAQRGGRRKERKTPECRGCFSLGEIL